MASDTLARFFELDDDSPTAWRDRLTRLRETKVNRTALRAQYVNGLRFAGAETSKILQSQREDPREAFLEEWENTVCHKKFFEYAKCDPPLDSMSIEAMLEFEQGWEIKLPASVFEFFARRHVREMIFMFQPTNNRLVLPEQWNLLPYDDDLALRVINENQGCCQWYVVWSAKEPCLDPPVYVGDAFVPADDADLADGDKYDAWVVRERARFFANTRVTAARFSEFVYDYAVEGSRWWIERGEADEVDFSRYDRNNPDYDENGDDA